MLSSCWAWARSAGVSLPPLSVLSALSCERSAAWRVSSRAVSTGESVPFLTPLPIRSCWLCSRWRMGESAWMDGEEPHTAENVGKTTLQYILVEVKSAPTKTPNR